MKLPCFPSKDAVIESAVSVPKQQEMAANMDEHLTIVVLGASGDLAKKKTFPALYGLFKNGYLPKNTHIVGYARSELKLADFHSRVSANLKGGDTAMIQAFLEKCTYVQGSYDVGEDFQKLNQAVEQVETADGANPSKRNRIFYMALPPTVFIPASENLKLHVYATMGWNRLIVEKPFGRDFDTSKELSKALALHWKESEIYRIDHYLGKEMVKNLLIIRFANVFMGAIWNRQYIDNIQITFKEPFGTEGRGGYFDEFGIIRDVMQNHLLQILSIAAMEKPVSLSSQDVRDEKVKVLRCIPPLALDDVLLGQYVGTEDKKKPGYLDDQTVPKDSTTPTFTAAVLRINNERWEGVPFILKCGKALNEQKTEIRVQFRDVPGNIFGSDIARNELVIRVQPQEAVYMKFVNKVPGLGMETHTSELDLSYAQRYQELRIPDAYEALILDVIKGDQSNFVRADELDAAWKIFTPLLHRIEEEKIKPESYTYGTRGPEKLDEWVKKHGFVRFDRYSWNPPTLSPTVANKL